MPFSCVRQQCVSANNETIVDDNGQVNENVTDITKNVSNMSIVSSSSSTCTKIQCSSTVTEHMLKCSRCKRSTHYVCTGLPPYQVYLFTRKNYRLYVCSNCVGSLPKEIVENCLENEKNELSFKQIVEDELGRALGENTKVADENKILLQKVKSLDEHQTMRRKHIDDKDKTIKSMLHKNNGNTPERITKSVQTDVNGENYVQVDGRDDISRLDVRTLQLHLESGINDKLAEFAANILDSV